MKDGKRKGNKQQFLKRIAAYVLALCLMAGLAPLIPMEVQAAGVENKLNELKNRYPGGKYWHRVNGNNTVTDSVCPHPNGSVYDFVNTPNGCGATYLGYQCVAFASQIFSDIFGEQIPDYRGNRNDVQNIMVGDYVRMSKGHSFIVTARNGNELFGVECNWSGPCKIGWGQRHYISEVSGFYHASNYDVINNLEPAGSSLPVGAPRTISDGDYFIVSALEGNIFNPGPKCLTIGGLPDTKNTNNANAELWSVYGGGDHVFTVIWIGAGFYKIKLKNSNDMCLEVGDLDNRRGANVRLWSDSVHTVQQWQINENWDGSGYTLQSRFSGWYLDVQDGKTDNATNIRLWEGNGSNAQKWYFIPWDGGSAAKQKIPNGDYEITTKLDTNRALSVNGTNIELGERKADGKHIFTVTWLGNGYYKIINKNSNLSLDVSNGSVKRGTNLQLMYWGSGINTAQRWMLRDCGNGYFNIVSHLNGSYVDLYNGGTANGTNISMYEGHNGNNQQWKFIPYVPTVDVASLTLNRSTLSLAEGTRTSLQATIAPYNATDKTVTWTSSNPSVASVDSSGMVTAKAAGSTTVTVTSSNGKTASCPVTVTHVYQSTWKSDEGKHWKACSCGARTEEAEHSFAWVIDQAATTDSSGLKHEICGTCGYQRNMGTVIDKLPPVHTHDYASAWKSDGGRHWKECICGAKAGEAAHNFAWITDQEATEYDTGLKHEECGTCGYQRNVATVIDKLPTTHTHDYGASAWKSDGERHWKECSCGAKTEEAAHNFAWVIDREATTDSTGLKHEACRTCGYQRNMETVIDKLPPTQTDSPTLPFADVNQADWYCEPAKFVFSRNIMTGMDGTHFGPDKRLSRAQFATILYRMEKSPETAYNAGAFPDVGDGVFYTRPAMWTKSTGIITGYADGSFGPADDITREQMAVMMYRYAAMLKLDTSARKDLGSFPDGSSVSGFAQEAVKWAIGEGLIQGDSGKINPQGKAERGQCATIIMRYMQKYGF